MIHVHVGCLALSRAIGDFEYKRNFNLSPQEQMVTGTLCLNIFNSTFFKINK